ncbi:MAG: SMP-30/gluconolactonase/LRE family protein [Bacteroidota bacterium]
MMCIRASVAVTLTGVLLASCTGEKTRTLGSVERFDPALDAIIAADALPEILGEGYEWSEGPVWIETEHMLLFSDIPNNAVMKWTEKNGVESYLKPSGFTGSDFTGKEPGANGLLIDADGKLVLCQHGDRRVAVMDASLSDPKPVFKTLADRWEGKRLNSPNDAVYDADGDLYFTDPPYGLPRNVDDPAKEIPFQGVYKLKADGTVKLLTDTIPRPNGIGISPDGKTLYVANSEGSDARWSAYDIAGDSLVNARIFFRTPWKEGEKGAPDGLKVDRNGNIFATGPGGVWILDPSGKPLGRIHIPEATANCALSPDGKYLFTTSDMYLLRVALKGY